MKGVTRQFITLGIVLTLVVITSFSGIFLWKGRTVSTRTTSAPKLSIPGQNLPTDKAVKSYNRRDEIQTLTEDFGSSENWPIFNQSYQSQYRDFRFKHPPGFEVQDVGSSHAWIRKDGDFYLGVDEISNLTSSSYAGSPEEQFKAYYSGEKKLRNYIPDLTNFNRIHLGKNKIFYSITEDEQDWYFDYVYYADPPIWDSYLGVIDNHVVEIVDLYKFPKEIVYDIIRSIEFKQHK